MSNPGSKAAGQLLQAAAAMVQTVTGVAVGAAVGASTAAGGSASPAALGGVQRNSLYVVGPHLSRTSYFTGLHLSLPSCLRPNAGRYSTLGGPPTTCDDPAAMGNGSGWTMGRLGVGASHGPCDERRRRLSKSSGGGGGGTTGRDGEDEEQSQFVEEEEDQDFVQQVPQMHKVLIAPIRWHLPLTLRSIWAMSSHCKGHHLCVVAHGRCLL